MSYRDSKRPKLLTRGSGCGCTASVLVVIGAYPWLFASIWSCAHRAARFAPCSHHDGEALGLAILVVAVAVFWLTKWAFDRGDNRPYD